ncbi:peptidoglycan D,D-transpeptidase FtsI family protein [Oceanomicrobium pacificus]|uniref:Penicillin-binding protein 2 n=1 Tax=Oceanomicrobium pacificus TaxID=2692916 RepID=A0A6B0TRS9_9RHOB|nr:penicillin-binding protein 2 [Oceanomicrobium pacificus]MXU65419.1 penicillin-binding protein 2 [Oceanomicrobium pacificus]
MIRRPLRPLARVIDARKKGQDPRLVEAEERAARLRAIRAAERQRAETRLLLLAALFLLGFGTIGVKMGALSSTVAEEPKAGAPGSIIAAQRATITDRKGRVMATNLETASLYAQPQHMADKRAAADGLAEIFPDLDAEQLYKRFTSKRKFLWIKRKLSPEQQQAVHDLGEPGLQFGPRELRLYPNGTLAAHILGGSSFGREGVHAAEIIGVAGVEREFDERLRDPAQSGEPLSLSIDLTVQAAIERVLRGGMSVMNAKGASAVLMKARTGEILSMVSLPDFDPNHRPAPATSGDPSLSPLFNRAAQGRYELGSTFKVFTAALSMEMGLASPDTLIETAGPLRWGKFKIRDFHNYGPRLSLTDVIVKSSNIGTARLAIAAGTPAQKDILNKLGFFEPVPVQLPEAGRSKPLMPAKWSDLSTMTISYGHGIAATPLHLAAAYATITNGGLKVTPTLLKDPDLPTEADRVISPATSMHVRRMLRAVVTRGTASLGDVEGYEVGGKTGTADKPKPTGGYYDDKVIATFASIFPASNPEYVLVVTLDEPVEMTGSEPRRTAGWTAVPVAAEIIRRVAPLMGMRPRPKREEMDDPTVTLARN